MTGCSKKDHWDGYVFPDKNNLLRHRSSGGEFQTLDECRDASMNILKRLDAVDTGYYECGKNCEAGSYYNRSCEDSFRGNYYK